MQNEATHQNNQLNEFLNGLKITFIISIAFFLALIFGEDPSSWFTILKVSLGYGISIYGMIWIAYTIVETFIDWREAKTKKDINFGFTASFATSLVGLSAGAVLGQTIRAFITGKEIDLAHVPFIVVIGSFISLVFIYRDRNKQREIENAELNAINLKLKERREKKYPNTITASLGNTQKVLPVSEILFLKSVDHYTHACTEEGEHIVDYSIKKLSEELDPSKFIQIHRNCIVSLEQVVSIENGSQWFVKTKSGEELKVSRSSRKKLRESLK